MKQPAAGTLLICNDTKRFLLVKRGNGGNFPGTWATVGGRIDGDEKPLVAAKREMYEETGIDADQAMIKFDFFEKTNDLGIDFYLYLGYCDDELDCFLNNENTDWDWFDMENLPNPLIPTLYTTLQRIF